MLLVMLVPAYIWRGGVEKAGNRLEVARDIPKGAQWIWRGEGMCDESYLSTVTVNHL